MADASIQAGACTVLLCYYLHIAHTISAHKTSAQTSCLLTCDDPNWYKFVHVYCLMYYALSK